MVGFRSRDAAFDDPETFAPAHLPNPGEFLAGADVLTGDDHVSVHATARDLFEERGVYDMTFGYNLAELNLDQRHPDAGYRYAVEPGGSVLRAEFTPTTPFCPQSETLTVGSSRAWNGLPERHDYDLVRVRVAGSHQESAAINGTLRDLERRIAETGALPAPETGPSPDSAAGNGPDAPF